MSSPFSFNVAYGQNASVVQQDLPPPTPWPQEDIDKLAWVLTGTSPTLANSNTQTDMWLQQRVGVGNHTGVIISLDFSSKRAWTVKYYNGTVIATGGIPQALAGTVHFCYTYFNNPSLPILGFYMVGSDPSQNITIVEGLSPNSLKFNPIDQNTPLFELGFQQSSSPSGASTTVNGTQKVLRGSSLSWSSPPFGGMNTFVQNFSQWSWNLDPCDPTDTSLCGGPGQGKCSTATGMCSCINGFSGPACSDKPSPTNPNCPSRPCQYGTCNTNTLTCDCDSGWYGAYCDQEQLNCGAHGSPSTANPSVCVCLPGWKGPTCEIPASGCPARDCVHGTCDRGTNSCVCEKGWGGLYCDQKVCPQNMIVDTTSGECVCVSGWKGDQCKTKDCPPNTTFDVATGQCVANNNNNNNNNNNKNDNDNDKGLKSFWEHHKKAIVIVGILFIFLLFVIYHQTKNPTPQFKNEIKKSAATNSPRLIRNVNP